MTKETLSQAEIDAILTGLSSGKVKLEDLRETRKEALYRSYDFRRPNKFSKEHLRTLQTLHDNYARILSSFLSGYLRANVVVRVASVDQFTFDDFVRSVPTPTLLTVFGVPPLKGMAIMEMNPQFLFPVIDLLFGGPGELPKRVRDLTDIELTVMRKLAGKLLENLGFAWNDIYKVTPEIESLETKPRLHQIISPSEIVAVITFTTVVGDGAARGLMNLCLPHITLDPMLSHLSSYRRYETNALQAEGDEAARIQEWVERAGITLSVLAGETEISVKDFLQLQVGDVVPISRRVTQDLDLLVEEVPKYKVQAGSLGRYRAVQVTSFREMGEA